MIKCKLVDPRAVSKDKNLRKRLVFLTNGGYGRRPSAMYEISQNLEKCIFLALAVDTEKDIVVGWCTLTKMPCNDDNDYRFIPSAKNQTTIINTYVAVPYRRQGIGEKLVDLICGVHSNASHTLSSRVYCYYHHSDAGTKVYDKVNKTAPKRKLYVYH